MKNLMFYLLAFILFAGCQSAMESPEFDSKSTSEPHTNNGSYKDQRGKPVQADEDQLEIEKVMSQLKIIKTGSIKIEVKDFHKSREQLDSLVTVHKGFVANEQAARPNDKMETSVTVKILPENFYPFIKSIEPLALRVHDKTIQTRDVTKEYTDVEARLKAREDVALRYKEILKKANTIEEILSVEQKLRSVLEDIEAMKGQIRYYNDQTGLSTVTVSIFQYLPAAAIAEAGFFTQLGQAFTFGWNDVLDVTLGFATNWHLILFWGLILFFAYIKVWKNEKIWAWNRR